MSISYEEAIATLKVMFPDWEEETLSTVLVSNQYHVERTIENILSMCGDSSVSEPEQQPPVARAQPVPQQRPAHTSPSIPVAAPAPAPARRKPAGRSSNPQNRGLDCSLPVDFLRPPGYQYRQFADEELAMMLQNELFQREVRAMFGDDFVRQAASGNSHQQSHGGHPAHRPTAGAPAGRNTGPITASSSSSSHPGSEPAPDTDMGILKAISSMGGAARRNLSMLAARFSNNQQQSRNGETGTDREFKPLVDGNGDDDDEVEFVSFDNRDQNRSRHVLQDTADTNDSENPLIHNNFSSTNASRVYQQRDM